MKIEFRFEVTPGTARRLAIVGATLIVVGVGAAAYANQIRFSSGQSLTAADLNNNFDELYARVAAMEASPFCGATSSKYNGAEVGGYSGAKALCTATCSSPSARMCTSYEVFSVGDATALPSGWYIDGQGHDCDKWTINAGPLRGAMWDPAQFGYVSATCDTALSVLCCK